MSKLLEKLKAAGSIKSVSIADSKFFEAKEACTTSIPIINVAFTGELTGGLVSGLNIFAGESKTFKSNLGLVCLKAYLDKHPDGICLFYDSEFGITPEYFVAHGIDTNRVIHIPIEHIEQLKFDIVKRLDEISRGDKVMIFIDSVGNLASKKEVDDAMDEKAVADMTRAKQLKSCFRIVTPHLTTKDIPCVVINHTYSEQGMFPKEIMSGGRGMYYSANNIFFITRSQEKDGTEVVGYHFTINIEKSRTVKEKSKMKFMVKFDGGINKWSGLLDIALESGHVIKPKVGYYSRVNLDTGEIEETSCREAKTNNKDFWIPILQDKRFHEFVKNKFKLAMLPMQNLDDDIEDDDDE